MGFSCKFTLTTSYLINVPGKHGDNLLHPGGPALRVRHQPNVVLSHLQRSLFVIKVGQKSLERLYFCCHIGSFYLSTVLTIGNALFPSLKIITIDILFLCELYIDEILPSLSGFTSSKK